MKIYGFLDDADLIQEGDEVLFEQYWEEIDENYVDKTYKEFLKNICVPDNLTVQIRRKLFDNVSEMILALDSSQVKNKGRDKDVNY